MDDSEQCFCPTCGTKISEDSNHCPECGGVLNIEEIKEEYIEDEVEQVFCPECGIKVKIDASICPGCGTELSHDEDDDDELFKI